MSMTYNLSDLYLVDSINQVFNNMIVVAILCTRQSGL